MSMQSFIQNQPTHGNQLYWPNTQPHGLIGTIPNGQMTNGGMQQPHGMYPWQQQPVQMVPVPVRNAQVSVRHATVQARRQQVVNQPQPQPIPTHQVQQPCRFFASGRGCKYGDSCQFSHNVSQTVPLCRFDGACKFGNRCHFRHSQPSATTESVVPTAGNGSPWQSMNRNMANGHPIQEYKKNYQNPYSRSMNETVLDSPEAMIPRKSGVGVQGLSRFELYVHGFIRRVHVNPNWNRIPYDIIFRIKKFGSSLIPGLLKSMTNLERRSEIMRDGLMYCFIEMRQFSYVDALSLATTTVKSYKCLRREEEIVDIFYNEHSIIPQLVNNKARLQFNVDFINALEEVNAPLNVRFKNVAMLLRPWLKSKLSQMVRDIDPLRMMVVADLMIPNILQKVFTKMAGLTTPVVTEAWSKFLFEEGYVSEENRSKCFTIVAEAVEEVVDDRFSYTVNMH